MDPKMVTVQQDSHPTLLVTHQRSTVPWLVQYRSDQSDPTALLTLVLQPHLHQQRVVVPHSKVLSVE
jgi:hypothetical protein